MPASQVRLASQTPVSRVSASNEEWYKIVKAGCERGIMVEVPEADIFINDLGEKVLAGAMGLDSIIETDNCHISPLRFISILCPIQSYFRKLRGQSNNQDNSIQFSMALVESGHQLIIDSEDLESCFNIYRTNGKWPGVFIFA